LAQEERMSEFNEEAVRKEARQLIMDVLRRKKLNVKPEEIKDGVSLTVQLGMDSLDSLQVMATVEKKFHLRIPEDEVKEMDDLAGIVRIAKKHWPAQA
jgi:acyl carrier protein